VAAVGYIAAGSNDQEVHVAAAKGALCDILSVVQCRVSTISFLVFLPCCYLSTCLVVRCVSGPSLFVRVRMLGVLMSLAGSGKDSRASLRAVAAVGYIAAGSSQRCDQWYLLVCHAWFHHETQHR
jgi:hypothetical protein